MKTIKLDGVEISEDKLREIIKNNPELVEIDHVKKGRWKPEDGEKYWTIDTEADTDTVVWKGKSYNLLDWKTNNVFKTKEEAEQRKAEIEALAKINDYIDENNCRVEAGNVTGAVTDKWFIFYNKSFNEFAIRFDRYGVNRHMDWYLKSSESAQEIIDKFEEELKVVFKIK